MLCCVFKADFCLTWSVSLTTLRSEWGHIQTYLVSVRKYSPLIHVIDPVHFLPATSRTTNKQQAAAELSQTESQVKSISKKISKTLQTEVYLSLMFSMDHGRNAETLTLKYCSDFSLLPLLQISAHPLFFLYSPLQSFPQFVLFLSTFFCPSLTYVF